MNSNLKAISVALETGNIIIANNLIKENEEIQTNFSDDIISSDIIDKEIEDCNGVNYFIDNLPEAIPCFTPDEMESLGVFDQYADKNYFNAESTKESYEWFLDYKATGNPGMDWYNRLRKVYAEYVADKSDKNKQRVLELGWNPYINPNEENIKKAASISKVKLAETYSCQIIDLTNINEEGLVDTAGDELKYWANHLFKLASKENGDSDDFGNDNVNRKEFFGAYGELYFIRCPISFKDKVPSLIQKLNDELIANNVLYYKVREDYKEEDNDIYIAIDINMQSGDLPIVQESDELETSDDSDEEQLVSIYNSLVASGKLTGDLELDYWNSVGVDLLGETYIEEGVSITDRIKDKEYLSKPFNVRKLIKDIKSNKKVPDEEKSKQMRILTYKLVESTAFNLVPFGFVWKFVYDAFFVLTGRDKQKEIEKLDEKIDLQTEVLQDKIEVETDSIMLKMYNTNIGALRDLKTYIKASLSSLKNKIVKEDTIIFENYFISQDDIKFNFDLWKKNSNHNLLYITGLSGSGKSTLGKEMARKYNAEYIEFDMFTLVLVKGVDAWKTKVSGGVYNPHPLIIEYVEQAQFVEPAAGSWNNLFTPYHYNEHNKFIAWLQDRVLGDGSLYILEGAQLFMNLQKNDALIFAGEPLIVTGTSMLKSWMRRYGRDVGEDKNIQTYIKYLKKDIPALFKYYFTNERKLQGFIKILNNQYNNMNEASVANKGLKPIFIVTSFTNSQFGHVIKAFTHDTYTHASMALDSKLNRLYTFTRGSKEAGDGFAIESLEGYLKQYEDSIIHVSVVFIKTEDYQKLKDKIDFYVNNIQRTTYNSLNCVRLVLGKELKKRNNELSMICSQFVDNMMKFISVDLTNKPSNLVSPADLHKLKNPRVFKLYEGKVKDYDSKAINKKINYILNKRHSVAIKESRLLSLLIPEPVFEAKEFPVQFDEEGNLLIKKKKQLDYLKEYQNSKKLHKSYRKYNNLEGMKYEAAKLWYLNTVILSTIENDTVTPEEGEKLRDARSKILTEFSLYMNDIQKMDNSFNFQSYYNSTPFSDDKIKVKKSTIQHTWELLKTMGKHILL